MKKIELNIKINIKNCEIETGLTPEIEAKDIFESSNFRVDSVGWKKILIDGEAFLENPKKDIVEFLEGEYKGEQLFTWDAAMRETKKAGKKMPTIKDFREHAALVEDVKDWPAAGYRSHSSGGMYYVGSGGYYWSSSVSGTYARFLDFSASSVNPTTTSYRADGFSVRCIKD